MLKLLIVDDSSELLGALKLFLEKRGYMACTLSNHRQIFDSIKQLSPDVLLLDIYLSGEDGRDICKKIREDATTRSICIILFSASPDALKNYKFYGADDYIEKPFNLAYLVQKIERAYGICGGDFANSN